jgi:pimeloyl-ACP methyl ester carboxylesterase
MASDLVARLDAQSQRHELGTASGQVVWRRFGDGPPLVLLHGGHGSWLHWARNIPAWAQRCSVLVPDMPGYGDSATPPEPTLASLVQMLAQSLDGLVSADTPLQLAGFSFGGLVAAHLAGQRGRVTQLILFGPAGHGGPRRPRGELRSWREAQAAGDADALRAVMHHNLCMHMISDPAHIDTTALQIHTEACLRTRFRSKPISRAGGLAEQLDAYAGPIAFIWGEHDVTATPAELKSGLTESWPDRRAVVLPNAGHWVMYEAAEPVNALVLDALSA